jgi:hypothetical protein
VQKTSSRRHYELNEARNSPVRKRRRRKRR